MPIKKLQETISEEELIKILKVTKKEHHRLAYALGFYQCMRISEVVKLLPENVDFGQKLIRIKEAKGSKDRNIPIAPQMKTIIKKLPVGVGARALQKAFNSAVKRAGINKDLHFHSLRHSGATYYLNVRKWNLRQVQVFLGHSSISTTEIYTHVMPQDLIDAMEVK